MEGTDLTTVRHKLRSLVTRRDMKSGHSRRIRPRDLNGLLEKSFLGLVRIDLEWVVGGVDSIDAAAETAKAYGGQSDWVKTIKSS